MGNTSTQLYRYFIQFFNEAISRFRCPSRLLVGIAWYSMVIQIPQYRNNHLQPDQTTTSRKGLRQGFSRTKEGRQIDFSLGQATRGVLGSSNRTTHRSPDLRPTKRHIEKLNICVLVNLGQIMNTTGKTPSNGETPYFFRCLSLPIN